jgi:alpha-galactosidase
VSPQFACLHGAQWSVVLERQPDGPPLWRHLGVRLDPGTLPALRDLRAAATFSLDADQPFPVLPQTGLGWFGPSTCALRQSDGSALPVVFNAWDVAEAAGGLTITARDSVAGISAALTIAAAPGGGLELATSLTNYAAAPVLIDALASAILPLPASAHRIVAARGRHNGEMVATDESMPAHGWRREAARGIPGHGGPCAAAVLDEGAGWHHGLVLALHLAWSGDTRLEIVPDGEGGFVASAAAVLLPAEMWLQPGETHRTPPLLLAISDAGRNGAAAQLHGAVRARLDWPGGAMTSRPVHLNSWEACYFAHDEARIKALAEAAAGIGVERFVLDDGWFRGRNDDCAGLGDWEADATKYPAGLAPVADHVRALGMNFGLWVEPEMVNPNSDLYRAHPDWVLSLPGRPRPTARGQLVLDMARAEVRDHLFAALDTLLRGAAISYLKWDHNRDLAPAGGSAQVAGSYDLLTRLRAAHPHLEIESCAGGGGRIDAGIARFTHRFWTSDNIDALARVAMQRGFLATMPSEVMGAHVGASPSHATGRVQSLDFRAAIAAQGHFGVELDPATLLPDEREKLAGWITFYKTWRSLIHGGQVLLGDGADGLLWQAQGNGNEWLLWVIRVDAATWPRSAPVRLPFATASDWQVQLLRHAGPRGVLTPRAGAAFAAMREKPQVFTGSWLGGHGLPLPALSPQSALIFHIKAVS